MNDDQQVRQSAVYSAVDLWRERMVHGEGHTIGGQVVETARKIYEFLSEGGVEPVSSAAMRHIDARFDTIERNQMSSQADVDALTTAVENLNTQLTAADSAIQQEISTLQGQGVDTTNLQSAVSDLSNAVAATQALVPPATA